MFIITKGTEPHPWPREFIESTVVRILTNHKTNHRKYLAVHRSHSASTGRFGSSFRGCISLVVGALLLVVFSQIGCSRSTSPFAKSQTLSPVEIFQRVSPSVFVVEALDEDGKTLMLGSAVAMARDFLITNCHVVQSASSLRVSRGKEHWTAKLIAAAPNHDLCGLRPSGLTLQPVEVRPSSKLATGEHVYAVGSPEGLELTFSEGVISALRETEGVRMIQTSAAISPGSSGGGLFDAQGNLVGVTTFYLKEGQSLNFALPGEWVSGMLSSSAEAAAKSSTRPSDAAFESGAWLDIGLEAVKKEEYDLAVHTFRKCADLKQSGAFQAWFELGKVFSSSTSDAYRAWLCSTIKPGSYCSAPGFYPSELTIQEAKVKGIAAFEKAIELKSDYAEAWQALASAYFWIKEYDQAITAAKQYTRLAPRDWDGWSNLGLYYAETESYPEAIDAWQKAEKVAPDQSKSGMLAMVGMAYAEKGDREQVLRIYQQLKGSDPKMAERFFREYVLPKPAATAPPEKMLQQGQLLRILRHAPIDDATRDKAWDAFYWAPSPDDFTARINKLNIPDTVKQSIYDLRFRKP